MYDDHEEVLTKIYALTVVLIGISEDGKTLYGISGHTYYDQISAHPDNDQLQSIPLPFLYDPL